jgi:hypothetical protein
MTLAGAAALWEVMSREPPPTPQLSPPKTISVMLYPLSSWNSPGHPMTEIPAGDVDFVWRLLTPDKYYEGGVNDWVTPLIAEAVITHEGQPDTRLLVRWAGKNPAIISVDGRNYFYGRPDADVHDGGVQLVRIVQRLTEAKPR